MKKDLTWDTEWSKKGGDWFRTPSDIISWSAENWD